MSPIPVTLDRTAAEIASSSMTIELSASTVTAEGGCLILNYEPPRLVADLVDRLGRGLPPDRPDDMLRLAEEVLAQPAGFPANWAETLADQFSRYED